MENRNEQILIVEDDPQIRNFICYSLKQEGFPYTTPDGQGALSTLVSEQIDLMLLDLGLPDFDGMDVTKKVREWSEMPSLSFPPVIRTGKRRRRWTAGPTII
jgi:two-component system KDP operon response regulator KdpE